MVHIILLHFGFYVPIIIIFIVVKFEFNKLLFCIYIKRFTVFLFLYLNKSGVFSEQ